MSAWGGGWRQPGNFWGFDPNLTSEQSRLYNEGTSVGGPRAFFGALASYLGGDENSNMSQFLRSQYNTEWDRYVADPRAFQPGFNWTTYLQGRAPALANQYIGMSASQRGARPAAFGAGRQNW